MVTIAPVKIGRGAWPVSGTGGTLDVTGMKLGSYYRAPAIGSSMRMPGLFAALAVRNNTACNVNDYAVYMAVKALQPYFGARPDGILGPNTELAIRVYQKRKGLWVDGVIGPKTSRSLFQPLIAPSVASFDTGIPQLALIVTGHIGFESFWDAGAVGVVSPDDVGLGQINGPSHPSFTLDDRLTPRVAIDWMVQFVSNNIRSMDGNIRDGIAAYNLGTGGARSWIKAGRPAVWTRQYNGTTYVTDVKSYIDRVLAAAI